VDIKALKARSSPLGFARNFILINNYRLAAFQ